MKYDMLMHVTQQQKMMEQCWNLQLNIDNQ